MFLLILLCFLYDEVFVCLLHLAAQRIFPASGEGFVVVGCPTNDFGGGATEEGGVGAAEIMWREGTFFHGDAQLRAQFEDGGAGNAREDVAGGGGEEAAAFFKEDVGAGAFCDITI